MNSGSLRFSMLIVDDDVMICMETLSALLDLCDGNLPVTGGYPSQMASNDAVWLSSWAIRWTNSKDASKLNISITLMYDVTWQYVVVCTNISLDIGLVPNRRAYQVWSLTRDHSVEGLSQWKKTLKCNAITHWLRLYPEWSCYPSKTFCLAMILTLTKWPTFSKWYAFSGKI